MNWKQLISNKRFGMEELHEARKDDRTEFQRDYDRLIFSAPFRRLQNNTQVFPLPNNICNFAAIIKNHTTNESIKRTNLTRWQMF